jgi:membrane protein YqaA with SNARE-associated domain
MTLFNMLSVLDPITTSLDRVIEVMITYGQPGLAIYSLLEVLLIIPPIESIYYPLLLAMPEQWGWLLLNVLIMNVIASAIGYVVGSKIGQPVLTWLTNEEVVSKAHNLFEKYGVLAIGMGAFLPFIPYTVVVFLAGITRMNFTKYLISGFLGRFPRYLVAGYVITQITHTINSDELNQILLYTSTIGMILFFVVFIIHFSLKSLKRKTI